MSAKRIWKVVDPLLEFAWISSYGGREVEYDPRPSTSSMFIYRSVLKMLNSPRNKIKILKFSFGCSKFFDKFQVYYIIPIKLFCQYWKSIHQLIFRKYTSFHAQGALINVDVFAKIVVWQTGKHFGLCPSMIRPRGEKFTKVAKFVQTFYKQHFGP